MQYHVTGGVYVDTTFSEIAEGGAEEYGPFPSYELAYKRWLEVARFKVDNACHRLVIVER